MGELFGLFCVFLFGIFIGVNSSFVNITTEDWNKAEDFCSKNEGIDKFVARTLDDNSAFCKNSARFKLKEETK